MDIKESILPQNSNGQKQSQEVDVKTEKIQLNPPKPKNPLLAHRKEKKYFDSADWALSNQQQK